MKRQQIKDAEGNSLEAAFGHALRRLRQDRGLSQERLGLESGYHRTYIGLLERGMKSPSLHTIFSLAITLKIEPNELIREVESKNKELLRTMKKEAIKL
jgi:transcriptional regulator with XRE-family HTH domain